jgi:uncharacterized protein
MLSPSQQLYDELFDYARNLPKINTHCHQLPAREYQGFDLDALLRNSYINWIGIPWDQSASSQSSLFEKIRLNSFFVWLQKSLVELYDTDEPLSASTWSAWQERIRTAYQHTSHAEKILTGQCGYRKCILDAYWHPGSNNDSPALFAPTFRLNSFFFGYSIRAGDHDGNNPYTLYPRDFILDLDEYVAWFRSTILFYKMSGCVAIKLPIAYDRGLDFCEVNKEKALQAFSRLTAASPRQLGSSEKTAFPLNLPTTSSAKPIAGADAEDIKTFQDYLFFQLCSIAAETDLPLQIHTGMGQGFRTNALQLKEAIQKFPETRFVLLHCSYPWIEDMSLLVTSYTNVYPDLSWVPLISTQAATTLLHELIERSTLDKLCWGCDTWTPEESYGSLLAFCHVLVSTLITKRIDGYLSVQEAYEFIDRVFSSNPIQLYKLAYMG